MKPGEGANVNTSRREFQRTARLVAIWVIAAWLILSLEHVLEAPLGHDKFASPNPPFEAVSAQTSKSESTHPQSFILNLYRDVVRAWLYN